MTLRTIAAIFSLTLTLHAPVAMSADVALEIVVSDGMAITESVPEILREMFRQELPNTELRVVMVRAPFPSFLSKEQEAELREEIKAKVAGALNPGDILTHLILDTHGETLNRKTSPETFFWVLGNITEQGADARFDEIFRTLKNRASQDLKIISNACSVFCGPKESVEKRALVLTQYFNAPDATVYGSFVPEAETFAFEAKYASPKHFLPTGKMVKLHAAIGIVAGTVFSLMVNDPNVTTTLTSLALTNLAMQILHFARPLGALAGQTVKSFNQGFLMIFKNGKIQTIDVVSKMKTLAETYGFKSQGLGTMCSRVYSK